MTINPETPYGNLMTDLIFKRVFNPDDEFTKVNLINLINDILKDELSAPVVDVVSRDKEQNPTGSESSRTSDYIFNPIYTIAISWFDLFPDDRFVHHISFCDSETKSRIDNFMGFTFIELKKFTGSGTEDDSLWAWTYLFKNLHKLRKLPPKLDKEKYKRLLRITQIANLSRKELEKYGRDLMSLEWDESATRMYYEKLKREIMEKAKEEAKEEARKEARKEAMEQSLKVLQEMGLTAEQLAELKKRLEVQNHQS